MATNMDLETNLEKKEKRERVQIDLAPEALQELDELQRKSYSATRVETIRRALLFFGWFINKVDPEDTLQVLNKEGILKMSFPASLLKGTKRTD